MAKVPFTKLKCKINEDSIPLQIGEEIIAVKQYLPIQEKLELIGNVVMAAHEQDANYSNPVKANVYRDLEVVFAYTNINFTDNQKEDILKLYDVLESNGVIEAVLTALTAETHEYAHLRDYLLEMAESLSQYMSSAKAIADDLLQYAPDKAAELTDNIKDFDEEKFRTLINIAQDNGLNGF